VQSGTDSFYTGNSSDSSPETVKSINPPNGAIGVPRNPAISLVMTKPVAPGSVTSSSVTLTPSGGSPVTLAIGVSSDGLTLTLALGSQLNSGLYTVTVPQGAFTDLDGNAVSFFTSSFSVGSSSETSCGSCTISLTNPAPGTQGVSITSTITATFSQPLNANSLTAASFQVYANNNQQIAGTVTNPSSNTLVFTPAVALPPGVTINVYVGYNSTITDYAGNAFSYLANATFTTASTTDSTPPQIISMTPGNGATNVGPYAPVTLTFNKSINSSTINSTNFAMYNGSTLLGPSISYSSDHRTVSLSTTLPYNATIQVAVNTGVQDYAGNNMASSYQASFTTLPQPLTSAPSVIQARPGNNAALTTPVTLFMSAPMNLATVQAGINVAQNGSPITGTATLTADLRGITWTPTANFLPGALIEFYLTSTATDTSGNPANAYKLSFTTQSASVTTLSEVSVSPGRFSSSSLISNPIVEIQFSRALNSATVTGSNSSNVKVTVGSSPGGAVVGGTVSLLNGNTVLRFTPAAPFAVNAYFYVTLTSGIQDTSGNAFAGDAFWVFVNASATPDIVPPTVTLTPSNNSTGIGDNAPVRLLFSTQIDTLSVNPTTVQLLQGTTQLPWTATFSTIGGATVATLLPQSPLPDSSVITVQINGVNDLAGNAVTPLSPTFTTIAGADFNGPVVVQQSIGTGNNTNVPTNSTFTWVFNKPLDPSTVAVNTSGFYIYDSTYSPCCYPPVTANVSADGRTVTIIPGANLGPSSTNDRYYAANATDLNGNPQSNASQFFTTAATTDTTAPTIIATNPMNTATNVPTNAFIEAVFSSPVNGASLGSVTLTGGGNPPYTTIINNTYYTDDVVIRIVPQSLLLPNTTYTVTIAGVKDVAGNTAATQSFSFTTGLNFQTTGLTFVSGTATTGSGTTPLTTSAIVQNVTDNPTFTITFDHAADFASLLQKYGGITLRDTSNTIVSGVTLNMALSADQKTVTITTSGLAAATTYHLWIAYGVNPPLDVSGNAYQSNTQLAFKTQ
jgi:hypothetical protein